MLFNILYPWNFCAPSVCLSETTTLFLEEADSAEHLSSLVGLYAAGWVPAGTWAARWLAVEWGTWYLTNDQWWPAWLHCRCMRGTVSHHITSALGVAQPAINNADKLTWLRWTKPSVAKTSPPVLTGLYIDQCMPNKITTPAWHTAVIFTWTTFTFYTQYNCYALLFLAYFSQRSPLVKHCSYKSYEQAFQRIGFGNAQL